MDDLHSLLHPKDAAWNGSTQAWLLDIYDWDKVIVHHNIPATLPFVLELCVGLFPCSLLIKGIPSGAIEQRGSGYISCHLSDGCEMLRLENIIFSCNDSQNENSPFHIQGSFFTILNSSFTGCVSSEDGGVIHSYDQSTVIVSMSHFSNVHSHGFGGAIAAYGGSVHVSDSTFAYLSLIHI